jgi:hypothetical protein|tara:strand:+ start:350 stop:715 length:366 start_codon:yes stop_codon:yes gene_type:complete
MLNFILPILKNPLTRMIGQKVIGGIQHKIEKDKIIKVKEIEAIKSVNIEQIKASTTSWKDEYLVVIFGLVFVANFVPHLQDYMERGWAILNQADPLFWYAMLALISGSFGMNLTNKLKGKK